MVNEDGAVVRKAADRKGTLTRKSITQLRPVTAAALKDVDLVMQTGLKPVSESAVEGEDSGEALQLHAGVGDWTPAHVFEWMHKSGLGVIAPLAIHKHVDGEQLLRLTEDAAVDLGVGDPVLAGIFARKAQGLASLAQNQ